MSGKLKFRVWNPTYQEMLYPSSPTKNGDYEEKIYLQLDGQLIGDFKHTGLVNCSENYVIQQFTGMLDNKGKEIYEGDILEYNHGNGTNIGYVGFTSGIFFLNYSDENNDELGYLLVSNIKVIGNIFENKELLKSTTRRGFLPPRL